MSAEIAWLKARVAALEKAARAYRESEIQYGGGLYPEAASRVMDSGAALDALLATSTKPQALKEQSSTPEGYEAAIERAFWNFDARRKGLGRWKNAPQSERDAFKHEVRSLIKSPQEDLPELIFDADDPLPNLTPEPENSTKSICKECRGDPRGVLISCADAHAIDPMNRCPSFGVHRRRCVVCERKKK